MRIDIFRFVRFVPVGACTGMLDALMMSVGFYIGGRESALWTVLMSAAVAYPLNFVGHRYITFRAQGRRLASQVAWFALLKSPNLALRVLAAVAIMAERDWGVVVLIPVIVWSFGMNRWIFTGTAPWQKAV